MAEASPVNDSRTRVVSLDRRELLHMSQYMSTSSLPESLSSTTSFETSSSLSHDEDSSYFSQTLLEERQQQLPEPPPPRRAPRSLSFSDDDDEDEEENGILPIPKSNLMRGGSHSSLVSSSSEQSSFISPSSDSYSSLAPSSSDEESELDINLSVNLSVGARDGRIHDVDKPPTTADFNVMANSTAPTTAVAMRQPEPPGMIASGRIKPVRDIESQYGGMWGDIPPQFSSTMMGHSEFTVAPEAQRLSRGSGGTNGSTLTLDMVYSDDQDDEEVVDNERKMLLVGESSARGGHHHRSLSYGSGVGSSFNNHVHNREIHSIIPPPEKPTGRIFVIYFFCFNFLASWTCFSVAPISNIVRDNFQISQPERLILTFYVANLLASFIDSTFGQRTNDNVKESSTIKIILGASLLCVGSILKMDAVPVTFNHDRKLTLSFFIVGLSQPYYRYFLLRAKTSCDGQVTDTTTNIISTGDILSSHYWGVNFAFFIGVFIKETKHVNIYYNAMGMISALLSLNFIIILLCFLKKERDREKKILLLEEYAKRYNIFSENEAILGVGECGYIANAPSPMVTGQISNLQGRVHSLPINQSIPFYKQEQEQIQSNASDANQSLSPDFLYVSSVSSIEAPLHFQNPQITKPNHYMHPYYDITTPLYQNANYTSIPRLPQRSSSKSSNPPLPHQFPGIFQATCIFASSTVIINTLSTYMDGLLHHSTTTEISVEIIGNLFQLLIIFSHLLVKNTRIVSKNNILILYTGGSLGLLACIMYINSASFHWALMSLAVLMGPLQPLSTKLGMGGTDAVGDVFWRFEFWGNVGSVLFLFLFQKCKMGYSGIFYVLVGGLLMISMVMFVGLKEEGDVQHRGTRQRQSRRRRKEKKSHKYHQNHSERNGKIYVEQSSSMVPLDVDDRRRQGFREERIHSFNRGTTQHNNYQQLR